MSPQQQVVFNKECILHITGGMFGGEVKRLKIVPIMLNLRPFSNRKPESSKNRADFFNNQGYRMLGAFERAASGKRGINPFRLKADSYKLFLCGADCRAERRLDFIPDGVDQLSYDRTFLRRQRSQPLHQSRQFTLTTEQIDANFLKLLY